MAYCLVSKVTITRRDFMTYLEDNGYYDRTNPLESHAVRLSIIQVNRVSDIKQANLFLHLKNLVKENFNGINNKLELNEKEYGYLFPKHGEERTFHVMIHFDNMNDINKFKLKHPKIYAELMND